MVASGLGVSVLPAMALQPRYGNRLVKEIPFTQPAPSRLVAIASRASFGRQRAVDAVAAAILEAKIPCLKKVAA
jgi:LysR family hydrogen peroxide-inducible transcriptional activator